MKTSLKSSLLTLAACLLLAACSHRQPPAAANLNGALETPLDRIVATLLKARENIPGGKVVVYELSDISGRSTPEGKLVAERLTTCLARTGRFTVIERSRLEAALKEMNMAAAGITDPGTVARAGRVLGAEAIITGTLTRLNGRYEINARVIAAETGSILAAVTEQLEEEDLRVDANEPYEPAGPVEKPGPKTVLQPSGQNLPEDWEEWPGWQGGAYGRYSLEGGKLTYRLGSRQHDHIDAPMEGGYYPGLLLSKQISGRYWTVEARVKYHMPQESGRWLSFYVWLGQRGARPSINSAARVLALGTFRMGDSGYHTNLLQFFRIPGQQKEVPPPKDYSVVRFERRGEVFKAWLSYDGKKFEETLSFDFPAAAAGISQKIVLGGQAYSAARSYAEYDYIKFNGKDLF